MNFLGGWKIWVVIALYNPFMLVSSIINAHFIKVNFSSFILDWLNVQKILLNDGEMNIMGQKYLQIRAWHPTGVAMLSWFPPPTLEKSLIFY